MSVSPQPFRSARFRIDRRLGEGGFGVVYLAEDLRRSTRVALKTLRSMEPGNLYRFKQEFRRLADVRHPNLVRLYELLSEDEQWFFTMEWIEGLDFRRHVCRPDAVVRTDDAPATEGPAHEPLTHLSTQITPPAGGAYDAGRLRASLRQLAEGVQVLHAAGILHRDLKPSNVAVRPDGRIVILDFGLAKEIDGAGVAHSLGLAGTPVYMSPEQTAGAPLTTASDWYSVGLMLYEALSGHLPFRGTLLDVVRQKQEWEPAPGDFHAAAPRDLVALCHDLLRVAADHRPQVGEILERVTGDGGISQGTITTESVAPAPVFVGREPQLEVLHEAFNDAKRGAVVVCLHGSSGIGKTALMRKFLDDLRVGGQDLAIVRARCYEQESVPYKGLDSLVDGLAQYLRSLPSIMLERILPREMHALERLFPVMEEARSRVVSRRAQEVSDPIELRRRGGRALRELLARLSDLRSIVLVIDDFQWGDVDSARLLQDILRPPEAPALLLMVSYRSEEAETSAGVREFVTFARHPDAELTVHEVALEGMSLEDSSNLALSLSRRAPVSREDAERIASECEGIPFFIHEVIRHREETARRHTPAPVPPGTPAGVDHVVASRLSQLDEDARTLLEYLAVAGRPVERAVLLRAAGVDRHAAALDTLRERRLVRWRRSAELEEIEIYHARMSRAVLMHVDSDILKQRHRHLALALEHRGAADAETLHHHYHEAGELRRAAQFAVAAAEQAWKALAFNHAADLYARALGQYRTTESSVRQLQVSLADALAHAGRGEEAARAYLAAATSAPAAETLQLRQKAMGQFLRSGRFDEGLATLRAILPALRLKWPETPRRALLALIVRRLQLRIRGLSHQPRAVAASDEDLVRIDACWSISTGLSVLDNVRGALFQTQGLLWALRSGEPHRIARAMALEAAFSAVSGARSRRQTEELFERASALARAVDTPEALALVTVARGMSFLLYGEWTRAAETLAAGEKLAAECGSEMIQELDNARVFGAVSLAYSGRLRELRARLPALVDDARQRGDLYAKTMLALRQTMLHVADGRPELARTVVTDAVAQWSRAAFQTPHYGELYLQTEIDLYLGDVARARERMEAGWIRLRRSLFLRNRFVLIDMTHLRARTRLAAAAADIDRDGMLRAAGHDAGTLDRQRSPWARGVAALVRAGIAATRGDRAGSLEHLIAAERQLTAADMRLYSAAARYRRGSLAGGPVGASLVAEAEAAMQAEGVTRPAAYASMLVPGRY